MRCRKRGAFRITLNMKLMRDEVNGRFELTNYIKNNNLGHVHYIIDI